MVSASTRPAFSGPSMGEGDLTMTDDLSVLYPFESRFLEVKGGRLHYVDEGPRDAPVLLLLHGNPTWSFYFRNVIRAFSPTYRVIALDHMGCGLSDKPQRYPYRLEQHVENVTTLAESLGLTDIHLGLHDWGGAIGMGFAMLNPTRIVSFTLFNTAAFPSKDMPRSIGLCRVPVLGAALVRGFNAFLEGSIAFCSTKGLPPEIRNAYRAPYRSWADRVALHRFVQDIPTSPRHPSYPFLARIGERMQMFSRTPMMLIWGERDFVFHEGFLAQWRMRFPSARVHRVPDGGHFVIEDAMDRIVPWMRTFLEEATAG
jgi:cis-3-alkyl-4-acyloxetan-2-one decarboxylase